MTGRLRELAGLGFLTWALAVAVLTLTPSGISAPFSLGAFLCPWCSDRPGADLVLNWILFIPCGLFLRILVGTRATLATGILITVGIEASQLLIPGRHPTLADLVLNTAGVATGAWLWARGRRPATLTATAVLAASAWLAPSLLLVPRPTDAVLFAQWTPDLAGMVHYDGAVLDARVAGGTTAFRLDDSERVARALAERAPVEVLFRAGTPPRALSPLYALYDENRVQNLLVGVLGSDLVVRGRTLARVMGLDQPDLRWTGALAGVTPGDTLLLRLHVEEGRRCLELAGASRCDIAPSSGDGYAFLLNLEGLGDRGRLLLALLWSAGLGAVLGMGWRGPARGIAAGILVGAAGWAMAAWSPDARPDALHTLALVVAAAAGGGLRVLADRLPFVPGHGGGKEGQGHHQILLHQDPPS